jgi:hypothetical protein
MMLVLQRFSVAYSSACNADVTNKRKGVSTRVHGLVFKQAQIRTYWITKVSSVGAASRTFP